MSRAPRNAVLLWTVDDVQKQLNGRDWADEAFLRKLREHEIDGPALVEITKEDLKEDFGIKELGRIKRILRSVALLADDGTPLPASNANALPPRSAPSPVPPAPTPDLQTFDVPISQEDLVSSACGEDSSYTSRSCPKRPSPPSPNPLSAATTASALAHSPAVLERSTPPCRKGKVDSPSPLTSPSPTFTPGAADVANLVSPTSNTDSNDSLDAIELDDLVPDGGRVSTIRSASIPPRPVTAIGHRPVTNDGSDDGSCSDILPAGHRHVWMDDPAVEIRHPTDLFRSDDPEEIPALALKQLIDDPLKIRQAWMERVQSATPRVTRPSPIPRPPVMELRPGGRLPTGQRVPEWVHQQWAHPNTSATQERKEPSSRPEPLPASPAKMVINTSSDPYPIGILERERRYTDLHKLFDKLCDVHGAKRQLDLTVVNAALHTSCVVKGEAMSPTRSPTPHTYERDGATPMDWDSFYTHIAKITRTLSPSEFDELMGRLTKHITEEGAKHEEERRRELLLTLFLDWDDDGSGAIIRDEVTSLMLQVNEVLEPSTLAKPFDTSEPLPATAVLRSASFVEYLNRCMADMGRDQFNTALFHLYQHFRRPIEKASSPSLTVHDLETAVIQTSSCSPIVMYGTARNPFHTFEQCSTGCGVSCAPIYVAHEKGEASVFRSLADMAKAEPRWMYVSVAPAYHRTASFLSELVAELADAACTLHRKFRMWIHLPGVSPETLPPLLKETALLINLSLGRIEGVGHGVATGTDEPYARPGKPMNGHHRPVAPSYGMFRARSFGS